MKKITTLLLAALTITAAFTSCLKNEDNDNAKQLYSLMGMINTNKDKMITGATIDDGSKLIFNPTGKTEWATTPDSIYRALIYFYVSNNEIKKGSVLNIYEVEPLALQKVLYMPIHFGEEAKEMMEQKDPIVKFVGGARANGYVNMQLTIESGNNTEAGSHIFSTAFIDSSPKNYNLRLCHSQNGAGKSYTADIYASIPVDQFSKTDTVSIIIPTKDGDKVYKFVDASQQGTNQQTGKSLTSN